MVIEMKASEDMQMPIQAVDYWLRVRRHQRDGDFERYGYFAGSGARPEAAARLARRAGAALPFGDGYAAEISLAGNSGHANRLQRKLAPRH